MRERAPQDMMRILPGTAAAVVIAVLIALTTAAHYLTPHHAHALHGVYRRLYYIPIIITALRFGLAGGLAVTGLITLLYIPHAFIARFMDPGETTEKVLEIVLYFTVALVAGGMQRLLRREARRRDEAERALRLKDRLTSMGELSAGFAHEIRNPAGSIKGAAQLLLEYFPEDDSRRKLAQLLVKESDRLEETVGKFLDFARPAVTVSPGLNLGDILADTMELLRRHGDAAGKRARLAPVPEAAVIAGDGTQLRQVFFNLGLNALQSMAEGGSLDVEVRREGEAWAVRFRDTGAGMDEATLERIFDPFFTTKERGTGLGLAVSYRIVEQHGGSIAVESRPGEGSVFTVRLPPQGRP